MMQKQIHHPCGADMEFATFSLTRRSHRRQPAFVLFAQTPAIFPIQPSPTSRATAFLLTPSTVVTARHAVRFESPPQVAGQPTRLHRSCVHADLAILSLSNELCRKYPITALTQPRSTRYTIHSPYAPPMEASLVRADIALIAYSGAFVPALTLKSRAPVPRGWSGSPVVDEFSRVVGVVVQSRGYQCQAIPSQIVTFVNNHKSPDVQIGYVTTSEFHQKLEEEDGLHSINGYSVSDDGFIDWGRGMTAPLQAAVFDAAGEAVDAVITRMGVEQVVKLQVSPADQAAAVRGRRGVCVVAGEYVMEAVSVELLEMRYGTQWASAELVDEVLCEGDDVVVFVRDAGEGVLFEKIESVDGRRVSGFWDVVSGGVMQVGNQTVSVPRGKVRPCFVSEW